MKFNSIDRLGEYIRDLAGDGKRLIVAIAGPPGAGKSTLAEALCDRLNGADRTAEKAHSVILPMDGFHYDNAVLSMRGLLARKGAPDTFDVSGFAHALKRIASDGEEVAIPVFDRSADCARAGAAIVSPRHRIVLAEGNYLLLDQPPWQDMAEYFDLTIFLAVDQAELERRLVQRWLDQGLSVEDARLRATSNDLPNADRVNRESRVADIVVDDVAL